MKTYGMRDFRENGMGMRDKDPPFQTLLKEFIHGKILIAIPEAT